MGPWTIVIETLGMLDSFFKKKLVLETNNFMLCEMVLNGVCMYYFRVNNKLI